MPTLSGGITLIDRTGAWLTVTPSVFRFGADAIASIHEALDPAVLVPFTERERELEPIVYAQLERRWHDEVPRELDRLPAYLADEEQVELLARGRRDAQVGLLVLTDVRLLFLFAGSQGTDLLDLRRADISAVDLKGLRRKRLLVAADGQTHEFQEIQPGERLSELRAAPGAA